MSEPHVAPASIGADSPRPLVSIVVPVFNEESNILPFHEAVMDALDALEHRFEFEFVFTDNHSTDRTFEMLALLASRDRRVRVFRFSKNFGYQRSILTGYMRARGDAAIQLDVDLQDPPELISLFLQHWLDGADVVYGVRVQRAEGPSMNAARKVFYRLVDMLSEEELPVDAGDFRLISRRVIEILSAFRDANPYLRGTIATLGFKQVGVEYVRHARVRGESKFPFSKLVSLALDGILNHSVLPLRLATYFGVIISFLTLLMLAAYAIARLLFEANWPAGFTTLAALILLSISVNAMLLGIIGEYLGRMFRQLRETPITIIEASIDPTVPAGVQVPMLT